MNLLVIPGNLKVLEKVWNWVKEKLTTEEISNKLLLGTESEGWLGWHWAVLHGNLN